MIWDVLGIEETKDLKKIKAAYMGKLKSVNPEDSPKEFMELRAAYEEATELAKEGEMQPAGPLDDWIKRVEDCYWDFNRRKSTEAWEELLSDSVCVEPVTKHEAEQRLLHFLMTNFRLSQNIWKELNLHFDFLGRLEELQADYPKEFIDAVIVRGVDRRETLPLEMFAPGADGHEIDALILLYYNVLNGSTDRKQGFDELMKMRESHPFVTVRNLCMQMEEGSKEAEADALALIEQYPGEEDIILPVMQYYNGICAFDRTTALLQDRLQLHRGNLWVRYSYLVALMELGRYSEAYEEVNSISKRFSDADFVASELTSFRKKCSHELLTEYEKNADGSGLSDYDKIELAWFYLGDDDEETAFELLSEIREPASMDFSYFNAMSSIHEKWGEYALSIEDNDGAIMCLMEMEPDGTEKTELNMKRIPEMKARTASCLFNMECKDEAFELLDRLLAETGYDRMITELYVSLLGVEKDYTKIVKVTDRYFAEHHTVGRLNYLRAVALFKIYEEKSAYDEFSKFINSGFNFLSAYVYKAWILIRNDALDDARNEIASIRKGVGEESVDVCWLETYVRTKELDEMWKRNDEEPDSYSEEQIDDTINEILSDFAHVKALLDTRDYYADWITLFYRQYARMTEISEKTKQNYDSAHVFELLDRGLEYDPEDVDLLLTKARVLKDERYDADCAEILYHVFKRNALNENGKREAGRFFRDDIDTFPDRVLELYEDLTDAGYPEYSEEDAEDGQSEEYEEYRQYYRRLRCEDRYYAGTAAYRLGQFEKAEEHFEALYSFEPEYVDGLKGYAALCLAKGEYERAVRYADEGFRAASSLEDGTAAVKELVRLKITALRRMGEYALAVEAAASLDREERMLLSHRIYAQFGRKEDDYRVLREWLENRNKYCTQRDVRALMIEHHILQGRPWDGLSYFLRLTFDFKEGAKDYEEMSAFFACTHQYRDAARFWDTTFSVKYDNYQGVYRRVKYCLYIRMSDSGRGNRKYAAELAQRYMDEADRDTGKFAVNRSMLLRNKALLFAVMGNRDEALELVQQMKANPLCERCPYHKCVDADICEMYIEAFTGDKDRAAQICREGLAGFPGAVEFRIMQKYLRIKE